MRYWVYKNSKGEVIGYNQTEYDLPSPAIEVSLSEFQSLGFYSPPVVVEDPAPPVEEDPLEELQKENKLLKAQLQAQVDRSDFIEDCIAEMATVVYGGV